MIKINLLGKHKESKKPEKVKKKRETSGTRTLLYIVILLMAVGLALYTYFPELFDFAFLEPTPEIPAPKEMAKVVPPPPDTTQKVAAVEEVKEEEPPPSKPPVVREAKPGDYLSRAYYGAQRDMNGFSALRSSIPKGIDYTLITINEGNFITELITGSKDQIAQYNINLKGKLTGGELKIIGINEIAESNKAKANIWGSIDLSKGSSGQALFKDFHEPSKVISQIRTIARKNRFVIKSYIIRDAVQAGSYKTYPVLLKLQGYDVNCVKFVESIKSLNLNFYIQKIASVPQTDKNRVMLAFNFEVFVPSQ